MTLRFIGKDPESGDHGSPAVWVHTETKDLIFQGWNASEPVLAESRADVELPDHEGVIRVPRRMIPLLKEALRVAESD
ncbi:hypothetical protein [Streptomyces sp. NPDC047097]|uniref:hypothetical protein n=1 Tax=Streptomyces sp. NPDC047097 TaxID=3155260 RepID=UPI0033C23ED0